MRIDETNIEIIKHLKDGRKSFKKIAEDLNITENTVRARVNKLIEEGVLEIAGLVNHECIPGHDLVIIGVKLKTMNLVKKAEEFSRLRGVVSASVVTGRYDVILIVLLREGFGLLEFYTQEIDKVQDVLSTETFVVYKGYNMKVPYVLD
ncbi:MAG: Lrp/AsnC family transcriptional regulator [Spirochaetes bacterium]|nr:MAG: Lrp/AsnC family transcriptional regulator [Spirochaetota bacterium]